MENFEFSQLEAISLYLLVSWLKKNHPEIVTEYNTYLAKKISEKKG